MEADSKVKIGERKTSQPRERFINRTIDGGRGSSDRLVMTVVIVIEVDQHQLPALFTSRHSSTTGVGDIQVSLYGAARVNFGKLKLAIRG